MEFSSAGSDRRGDGPPLDRIVSEGVQMCPFLRNFTPSSSPVRGGTLHGPIFEDGPSFDLAFKLFHGENGILPLSRHSSPAADKEITEEEPTSVNCHPLAATATAAISLSSALGASGPFGFDTFMSKRIQKTKHHQRQKREKQSEEKKTPSDHEACSNDWLQTGKCPIAKSLRAVSCVLPLVTKALQPPPGVKLRCPPAIVACRAALARTAAVKALKPQPLSTRILAVGLLGMSLNVPLGIWREHTDKFSPAWFTAVHASVPFIAMLRKAVHMPKYAMAFTFAASILGQVIGSRAERRRLGLLANKSGAAEVTSERSSGVEESGCASRVANHEAKQQEGSAADIMDCPRSLQGCGKETWNFSPSPRLAIRVL